MGYFKQYDDIVGYTLEEIIVSRENQNKGLGSALLAEVEHRVKEKGASCVELQAVSDEMHERYYGKAGYKNAKNFVMKVKWFE
jgi:predicted N-acetyltransferase YhbS